MIRSFARNGLIERSIVVSKRSPTIYRPLGHTQLPLFSSSDRHHYPLDNIFSATLVRPLSTTSSSNEKPSTTSPEAPQTLQKPRKAKVELKPSPVKPTKLPQATASGTAPNTPVSHPTLSEKTTITAKEIKDEAQGTLTAAQVALKQAEEAKQRDIDEAIKHGIMAPPPEGAGAVRAMIHKIWEFMKFYFRGVKMVVRNRQRTKEMQKRVAEGGHPLSRWEARFIATYQQDMKRLIPFLIIVLIVEEIVPLIALYAPGMLPSTCILPSQQQRIKEKRRERLTAAVSINRPYLRRAELLAGESGVTPLSQLDAYTTSLLSTIFNASSLIPLAAVRRRRIAKKLAEIAEDDKLLIREDFGARLTTEEIVEALEERGMVATHMKPADQFNQLRWWLKSVADTDEANAVGRRVALAATAGTRTVTTSGKSAQ